MSILDIDMRKALGALLCFTLLAAAAPLPAVPGFKQRSWTGDDGAPPTTTALAQSADGYLWVGTETGLYRFDGITFERMPRLERRNGAGVAQIIVDGRGRMWLRYGDQSLGMIRDGRSVPLPGGSPAGRFSAIAAGPDGTVWATNTGYIHRYRDGRWRNFALPGRLTARRILPARDGRLWIITDKDVSVFDAGTARRAIIGALSPGADIREDANGRLWLANGGRLRRIVRPGGGTPALGPVEFTLPPAFETAFLRFDASGALWVTSPSRMIVRFPRESLDAPPGARAAPRPFATAHTAPIYTGAGIEDREGNIWIPTELGMDRFRPVNLSQQSARPGPLLDAPESGTGIYQVIQDGLGTLYLRKAMRFFRVGSDHAALPLPIPPTTSPFDRACASRDGGLWYRSGPRSVRRFDGPDARVVTLPQAADAQPIYTSTCTEDTRRRLWIGISGLGFYRFDPQGPRQFRIDAAGDQATPFTLDQDGRGGVLSYHGYGDTVRITGDNVRSLWPGRNNPLGFVEVFHQGPRFLFIGGESGLARYDGRRFKILSSTDYPYLQDISGIVQNARGETWLLGKAGLTRLSTRDLEARFDDPNHPLPHRTFDHDDGLFGVSESFGWSNLAEGKDGWLWLATNTGIFSLDTRDIRRNNVPPPVSIKRLVAGGIAYPPIEGQRLPTGVRDLQIDFTALSFAAPKRVRFLYRLTGQGDGAWVDPGQRREAIYTNLGPGQYRFQVIAANNDGVWNRTGATLAFTIPPTFFQTWLFFALCVLAGLALLWALYSIRMRRVAAAIRLRIEDRVRERERIARELHDTLLQGFQGLTLHFQSILELLPHRHRARDAMERALERADDILLEGRDRVQMLREATEPAALHAIFAALAKDIVDPAHLRWTIQERGAPRLICAPVVDDSAQIVREALANAVRHARAKTIRICLDHASDVLTITVTDDGLGLPAAIRGQGRREGHFGLVGMRERAGRMGGSITFGAAPGGGTEVRLTIPARIAYR